MGGGDSEVLSDVCLLEMEMSTLWTRDDRGRLRGREHLVIGTCADGHTLAIGSSVPDTLAEELQQTLAGDPTTSDPAAPPASLQHCRELLQDALGDVELSSGPSYLIPPSVTYQPTPPLERSRPASIETVTGARPHGWSVQEGEELFGRALWALMNPTRPPSRPERELLGPWAIVRSDSRAVATCHTAAWSSRGAEVGVWTHPAFRGRGYAAALTAAWANLVAPSGRRLFYSTDAMNVSSQRVAARLDLRLVGWLWKISPTDQPAWA